MNERLVRGESNTNVPFPTQPSGSTPGGGIGDTPQSAGGQAGLLADSTSGAQRNNTTPNNNQLNNVAPF